MLPTPQVLELSQCVSFVNQRTRPWKGHWVWIKSVSHVCSGSSVLGSPRVSLCFKRLGCV